MSSADGQSCFVWLSMVQNISWLLQGICACCLWFKTWDDCAWHAFFRSLDKLLKITVNGRQIVNYWFLCHWNLISGFTHLFQVLFCGSFLLVWHELQSQHRPWYCLTLLLTSMGCLFQHSLNLWPFVRNRVKIQENFSVDTMFFSCAQQKITLAKISLFTSW